MKTYIVTVSEKYPSAGETPSRYNIEANNKKEAISKARRIVGYRSRFDSTLTYSVMEA